MFNISSRHKSKVHEKVTLDDPAFDYPNGDAVKKSPLYDELSIPFIDASPAPTPRTGRSTERFAVSELKDRMDLLDQIMLKP